MNFRCSNDQSSFGDTQQPKRAVGELAIEVASAVVRMDNDDDETNRPEGGESIIGDWAK